MLRLAHEENKVIVDVAAGTGTVAAWLEMAPDAVALVTGVWVLIRIWETKTVQKLLGKDV
jgi:adenine/guanine phosphoribosyltransferase-like PRPP-binding protein